MEEKRSHKRVSYREGWKTEEEKDRMVTGALRLLGDNEPRRAIEIAHALGLKSERQVYPLLNDMMKAEQVMRVSVKGLTAYKSMAPCLLQRMWNHVSRQPAAEAGEPVEAV